MIKCNENEITVTFSLEDTNISVFVFSTLQLSPILTPLGLERGQHTTGARIGESDMYIDVKCSLLVFKLKGLPALRMVFAAAFLHSAVPFTSVVNFYYFTLPNAKMNVILNVEVLVVKGITLGFT